MKRADLTDPQRRYLAALSRKKGKRLRPIDAYEESTGETVPKDKRDVTGSNAARSLMALVSGGYANAVYRDDDPKHVVYFGLTGLGESQGAVEDEKEKKAKKEKDEKTPKPKTGKP